MNQQPNYRCWTCLDEGFVFTRIRPSEDETGQYEYVFRCTCPIGRSRLQTGIPIYEQDVRARFPILTIEDRLQKACPLPEEKDVVK